MTTVVITMAGRGQRFRDAGHDRPKYEIEVHGKTLFEWSLQSLAAWWPEPCQLILIARREDAAGDFVRRTSKLAGLPDPALIELDTTTDGQATTALIGAREARDLAAPMLVYNIDTHVRAGAMAPSQVTGAGWIPCFAAQGDHWSFVELGADGLATRTAEKQRISPHATLGLYWFDSAERYADAYARHFAEHPEEAGERYIAPMYNRLIADGAPVTISDVDPADIVPLGTPAEVAAFEATAPPA